MEGANGFAVNTHEPHSAHCSLIFHFFLFGGVNEVHPSHMGHHLFEGCSHPPGPLNFFWTFLFGSQASYTLAAIRINGEAEKQSGKKWRRGLNI